MHTTVLWDAAEAKMELIDPVNSGVQEFLLIASAYGESRHTVLARFPLSPRP